VSAIDPTWGLEGGRVAIRGEGFPVDGPRLPVVRFGPHEARVVHASPRALGVLVPPGLTGGPTTVSVDDAPGASAVIEIGTKLADELHLVDSPVFDRQGNLYVTFSGTRGQKVETALFRITPGRTREALPAEILNPTSLAVDPAGSLYVSSRFEGTVYRIGPDGVAETFATDLGIPCGLAFAPDGRLYVGDRSGSILCVTPEREIRVVATLPPSVAAYHLAMGPDLALYVTAPTLSSQDGLFRVEAGGQVSTVCAGFGRPQGLAFDREGRLYVVEALAGATGVFRLHLDAPVAAPDLIVAGVGLIGVALDPSGGLVVATGSAVYRFDVPLHPLVP
jgi:sugar lactone lactonase YvrE